MSWVLISKSQAARPTSDFISGPTEQTKSNVERDGCTFALPSFTCVRAAWTNRRGLTLRPLVTTTYCYDLAIYSFVHSTCFTIPDNSIISQMRQAGGPFLSSSFAVIQFDIRRLANLDLAHCLIVSAERRRRKGIHHRLSIN